MEMRSASNAATPCTSRRPFPLQPLRFPGSQCASRKVRISAAPLPRSSRRFRSLEELLQGVETSVNVLDVVGCIVLLRQ